jgi:hypothetical protein
MGTVKGEVDEELLAGVSLMFPGSSGLSPSKDHPPVVKTCRRAVLRLDFIRIPQRYRGIGEVNLRPQQNRLREVAPREEQD